MHEDLEQVLRRTDAAIDAITSGGPDPYISLWDEWRLMHRHADFPPPTQRPA